MRSSTDLGSASTEEAEALAWLLRTLDAQAYDFVTPTLSTVRRWISRPPPEQPSLRDVFGWGFPFPLQAIEPDLLTALKAAGALEPVGPLVRSRLRGARVHGRLFLHSAYPGAGESAVFVGPDSYRFADFIRQEIAKAPVRSLFDVGVGAGVGAVLAHRWSGAERVFASDLNPASLRLAKANAAHAGVPLQVGQADGLAAAPTGLDLIVANPPYVGGVSGRTYRDGGGALGEGLALAWAKAALSRLAPGGRLLLYTGAPIVTGGADPIRTALAEVSAEAGAAFDYRELDPDIFSGELRRAAYAEVERIAAVGAVLTRPA